MGNSNSSGKPHWSESSQVLHDAEKIRTQPTNKKPAEVPVNVDTGPAYVGANTGSKQYEFGKGAYGRIDGPNGEVGAKKTPDGFKVGAQANVGGVSVGHHNEDHDYSVGLSLGKGPGGLQVHGGEMPGVTVNAGPFMGTARSTALNKPIDPQTAEIMKILGSH